MKRKIIIIVGLVLILAGAAVFSYPLIKQAYSAYQQNKIMEEVKQQIFENLNAAASQTPAEATPTTAPSVTPETGDDGVGTDVPELPSIESSFADIGLQEEVEDASPLESDRLRGQTPFGIIEIEKIDLVYAIVDGIETWNIGVAIGHFPESAQIGEEGNCAMAGHRGGTSGPYFRDIDELEAGDEIVLTDMNGDEFVYAVTESMIVEPTDVYVVEDLGVPGKYLTLVTCTNNGTLRLIVRAQMVEESEEAE